MTNVFQSIAGHIKFAIIIGLMIAVVVFLTNIVFPRSGISDSQYLWLYPLTMSGLILFFGLGGYLASGQKKTVISGAVGGTVMPGHCVDF